MAPAGAAIRQRQGSREDPGSTATGHREGSGPAGARFDVERWAGPRFGVVAAWLHDGWRSQRRSPLARAAVRGL